MLRVVFNICAEAEARSIRRPSQSSSNIALVSAYQYGDRVSSCVLNDNAVLNRVMVCQYVAVAWMECRCACLYLVTTIGRQGVSGGDLQVGRLVRPHRVYR